MRSRRCRAVLGAQQSPAEASAQSSQGRPLKMKPEAVCDVLRLCLSGMLGDFLSFTASRVYGPCKIDRAGIEAVCVDRFGL